MSKVAFPWEQSRLAGAWMRKLSSPVGRHAIVLCNKITKDFFWLVPDELIPILTLMNTPGYLTLNEAKNACDDKLKELGYKLAADHLAVMK